jgi:hypothetical protein
VDAGGLPLRTIARPDHQSHHHLSELLRPQIAELLTTSAGRTFSAMPRSNNQTSPRWGAILFRFEKVKQFVGRVRDFPVVQRA